MPSAAGTRAQARMTGHLETDWLLLGDLADGFEVLFLCSHHLLTISRYVVSIQAVLTYLGIRAYANTG